MKTEMLEKIIKGIVRNEFEHVSNYENEFNVDEELEELSKINYDIYKKISSCLEEEELKLFNNYIDNFVGKLVIYELLYFKEGLRAGLTNLKFLNEINGIETLF